MKPGGTEGGQAAFLAGVGLLLAGLALYLFFDSVYVTSGGGGWISGWMGGMHGMGGMMQTTSHGLIFVPLLLGVVALFYDAQKAWAWGLLWVGLAVVLVEILSRLEFRFSMKTSHLIVLMVMLGAGIGLLLRSFKEDDQSGGNGKGTGPTEL